ncbi:MAG: TonB-dependent receptor [FCB group bacterium]|nr:TonB-dependent receptor [FCB group bacterium]
MELISGITIRGIVKNKNTGKPIVGANIEVIDTRYGTATDEKGVFSLQIEATPPVSIKISHIAYQAKSITIVSEQEILVELLPRVIEGTTVDVTGAKQTYQADITSSVDLIDIKEVELAGARDLGSALRRVSSVKMDYSNSGKQTVSIRGSNATDVAVYLDGVKLNDANSGVADLSMIDLNSLEQIQVIKGGSTTLFGSGAVGGVVNLESKDATRNSVSVSQGIGQTFNDDLDLSLSATGVYGPVGFGGRFSGQSRAYGGRTLTTSLFQNLFSGIRLPAGKLDAKWYRLEKALTFPSGSVDLADGLTMASIRYRGNIAGLTDWEIFAGDRKWAIKQDFFTSMKEQLRDRTQSVHISKLITRGKLESTILVESELQSFTGNKESRDIDGTVTVKRLAGLTRTDYGAALASKFVIMGEHPFIDRIDFELGLRFDQFSTIRNDRFEFPTILNDGTPIVYHKPGSTQLTTLSNKRIGMNIEGRTPKVSYSLFVNQGSNKRLPTLSDYFHFSYAPLDSLGDSTLTAEQLLSTEVNLNLIFTNVTTSIPISAIEFTMGIFVNDYINKIAYLAIEDQPPVPFNTRSADIKGIESSLKIRMFENRFVITASSTRMDISNPFVFPYKPKYRNIITGELNLSWVSLSYDYLNEGEQYYFVPGAGVEIRKPRENANLNLSVRKKILGLNWTVSYTWRNLLSKEESKLSLEESLRKGFNYFEKYREVVTVKIEL